MSDITTAPTDSIPATIAVPTSVPTVFVSTALANVSSAASSFLSSSINASASTTSTSASSSPTSNSNPFFPDFSGNYSNVPGTVVSSAQNQSGLQTQLLVCGGVGLICFLVFCYLRPRWTEMFAPRLNMKRHKPPELPNSFFGWIIPLIKVDEQELLQTVGLDAVVMLQFFVMAIKLFGICSFFGIVTLIPISVTTGNTTSFETENVTNGGLDRLAITVLDDSSDYLVAYLIYTYLFCLLTFFFLYRNYRTFVGLRAAYLIRLSKTLTNRSVMVTGIPRNLRTDEKLAEYYEHLGIGHVERSHIVRHVSELRSLLSKRTSALRNLEKAYVNYWGNPCRIPGYDPDEILTDARLFQAVAQRRMQMEQEKADENNTFLLGLMEDTPLRGRKSTHSSRPQIRLGFLGLWGKKVDAIDHYTKEFDLYDRKVLEARNSTQFEMTSVGFVTFENMSSALIAAQIAIHPEPFACRTVIAYEPRDVLWQNVTIGGRERLVREIFVWAITIALSLFWIFPISIFSSLTSMKALERVVPGLVAAAEKNNILHNLLQGTLPTLAVQIFMAVLPLIFDALGIVQGQRARSDIAEATFSKYFFFLLFNVLLVFTLVSTIFKTIEQIVKHPAEVLNMLSTSLPAVAPFFINYTILQGMLLQPLSLLLLGALIIRGFSYLFLCKTPRDYAENRAPWTFNYGVGYPPPLLIFIIVLVYSTISPIILLFGTIYFCIAYLVYKYQFLYVYFQPYDALGSAWPMVFPRIIVGMIIFQLTMTGLFVLKKAITLGVLCVPLIVMTIIYKIVMDLAFRKNSQCLPMQLLRDEMTKMPLKKGDTTQLSSDDDDDDEDDDKDDTDKEDDSSNAYKQASDDSQKKLEPIQEEKSNESSTSGSVKDRWKKAAAMALTQTGQSMMSLRSTDVKPKKRRRVVLDEDDYEAIPDNRTDYRQPPMMLNPGVLDTGFKKFGNPYIIGILPQLWLPVKSNEGSCNANIPLDRSKRVTSKHPGDASGSVANELAQLLRRVESMRRQSIRRVTKKKESNEPLSSPPSSSAPVEQDSSSPSSNVSLLRRVFRHSSSAVHAGGQQPSSSRNSNTRPASISQQPINRDSSDQEQTSRQDSGDDSTTSSLTIQKELDRSNIPIW